MAATENGKKFALEQLEIRRKENSKVPIVDNSSLPAGSPMFFRCLTCGATIAVPEMWLSKPDLCEECSALETLGWLE